MSKELRTQLRKLFSAFADLILTAVAAVTSICFFLGAESYFEMSVILLLWGVYGLLYGEIRRK